MPTVYDSRQHKMSKSTDRLMASRNMPTIHQAVNTLGQHGAIWEPSGKRNIDGLSISITGSLGG
jgi:hypothetical protein